MIESVLIAVNPSLEAFNCQRNVQTANLFFSLLHPPNILPYCRLDNPLSLLEKHGSLSCSLFFQPSFIILSVLFRRLRDACRAMCTMRGCADLLLDEINRLLSAFHRIIFRLEIRVGK